jgi:glucan phosphoethanolaminetransferase (alkaline phosphatase superfamily)
MYTVNKGIGKSAEFKGLKGIAIPILFGMLFLGFGFLMVLQIMKVATFKLLIIMVIYCLCSFGVLYWFVKKFGQNGFEKFCARLKQSKKIRANNPNCFQQLLLHNEDD